MISTGTSITRLYLRQHDRRRARRRNLHLRVLVVVESDARQLCQARAAEEEVHAAKQCYRLSPHFLPGEIDVLGCYDKAVARPDHARGAEGGVLAYVK